MDRITLDDLEADWADVEAVLDQTGGVDRWCSGPDWVIPVHLGFGTGTPALFRFAADGGSDNGAGAHYVLLAQYRVGRQTALTGLEPQWGFASPVISTEPEAAGRCLANHLIASHDWAVLVLPGMPHPDSPSGFTPRLARGLAKLGPVRLSTGITRQVADLRHGFDSWWARRASRFRRNLRQASRRATAIGVELVDVSDELGVFDRLLAIERQSWKGRDSGGMLAPDMAVTYRAMVERLQARGRLHAHVARLTANGPDGPAGRGRDVGFIVGGVRAGRYRGLQISYAADVADLSIGHLLQLHQIKLLCSTGIADTYDLGMDLEYKRRWADEAQSSFTLVVERS